MTVMKPQPKTVTPPGPKNLPKGPVTPPGPGNLPPRTATPPGPPLMPPKPVGPRPVSPPGPQLMPPGLAKKTPEQQAYNTYQRRLGKLSANDPQRAAMEQAMAHYKRRGAVDSGPLGGLRTAVSHGPGSGAPPTAPITMNRMPGPLGGASGPFVPEAPVDPNEEILRKLKMSQAQSMGPLAGLQGQF